MKKKQEEAGMDIIAEVKEPFTFARFYEEHIVGRIKKAKKFLDEKGILFFFLSPFQQRNRLIGELCLIIIGVLLGVVPRTQTLLNQLRERNASAEMTALIESGEVIRSGSISLTPLASSQYNKEHLLAFYVDGKDAPSTAERYKVELTASSGTTVTNIQYKWAVVPFSEEGRILLIYTNNQKDSVGSGLYGLRVSVAKENLNDADIPRMDIVLSNSQKTTLLYGKNGIDLSVLTDALIGTGKNQPIAKAETQLQESLDAYQLELERIGGLPLNVTPAPPLSTLKDYVAMNRLYNGITDTSTTKDVTYILSVSDEERNPELSFPVAISYNGVVYNQDLLDSNAAANEEAAKTGAPIWTPSEEESIVIENLNALQEKADAVLDAIQSLNAASITKYDSLKGAELTLNQALDASNFTKEKKVKAEE